MDHLSMHDMRMDDSSTDEMSREGDDPLAVLRRRIDAVDAEIVKALGARYRLAERIGALKSRQSLPTLDPAREAVIVREAVRAARRHGIPEEGVRHLFWSVLALCREGVQAASRVGEGSRER